jgi:hypothetical protein
MFLFRFEKKFINKRSLLSTAAGNELETIANTKKEAAFCQIEK